MSMSELHQYIVTFTLGVKRPMAQISEPELLKDMRGFNGQEGLHYQCHRRLKELWKAN